ncbi:MAG: serine/threonine-protein kinase [Phycisphaerales bacterium]
MTARPTTRRDEFLRAESIFFEVAALAPGDRDGAIARLCAGDPRLEAGVRSLVGSAARIGSFLEQPALGRGLEQVAREAGIREPPDELVGATVGPFRITRRIASGGMGTVYLGARSDGQFEQTVAIKIVKRGMDSEEILRRFRAERQTLAALDHPNIARLLDGGVTPDGRPFLVMEHVDGKPIDTYCDEHRLRVRERLELFRAVCDAVHHAHKNLVIHRDLKPGNILVTPGGVPKLLDFGIAKVLSGGTTTQAMTADTDRRLTPEYASPEQVAGGPVTTASDVYSLGVILYELLTGTHPYFFSIRTGEELRRIVCTVVPPAPSAAVTVRASRKRETSRLSTNGHAAPEPATSGPTGAASEAAAHTRGVSSTRLRGQLRGDLDTIVLMALRKEPARRYESAEQLGADIGRYLGGMPVQARRDTPAYRASKFMRRHPVGVGLTLALIATLAGSTVGLSSQGRRLERQRDALVASNKRLHETRKYLHAVIGSAETGSLGPGATLGDVVQDAIEALKTAPPGDLLTRAAAEQAIGRAAMSLGMLAEARPLLESAAAGFAALPADEGASGDIRGDLAELLYHEGKPAEAEGQFRALLAEERASAGGARTEREGLLLNNLGACLRVQRKAAEAAKVQREAAAVRAATGGPESLEVAESLNNLGSALFETGDTAGAIEQFEKALTIRTAKLRPDHPLVVRLEANLGLALLRAGRPKDAEATLRRSAEAWDTAFGPEHPGRVATITSLSMALRKQNRHDEALLWLRRALAWQGARQPAAAGAIAATEANIGMTLAEQGKDAQAEATLARVIPSLREPGKPALSVLKNATESLAGLYERSGRAREAAELRATLKPPE